MAGLAAATLILGLLTGSRPLAEVSALILGLVYAPIAIAALAELCCGVPAPRLEKRGETFVISTPFGSRRVAALEIRDVRHGVLDLTPIRHYGACKALLDTLLVNPEFSYTLIYEKSSGAFRAVLLMVPRRELSEARLLSAALEVVKQLRPLGVEARPLQEPPPLSLKPKRGAPGAFLLLLLAALSIALLRVGAYALGGILALYSVVALILACSARRHLHHVEGELLYLKANESMFTEPSYEEMYSRSRWLFELLNSLEGYVIIVRLDRAPAYVGRLLERRAFSLYERATAFDKLSLMVKADRLLNAADRHFHRREALLEVTLTVIATRRAAKALRRAFEVAGLSLGKAFIRSPALWGALGLP